VTEKLLQPHSITDSSRLGSGKRGFTGAVACTEKLLYILAGIDLPVCSRLQPIHRQFIHSRSTHIVQHLPLHLDCEALLNSNFNILSVILGWYGGDMAWKNSGPTYNRLTAERSVESI